MEIYFGLFGLGVVVVSFGWQLYLGLVMLQRDRRVK